MVVDEAVLGTDEGVPAQEAGGFSLFENRVDLDTVSPQAEMDCDVSLSSSEYSLDVLDVDDVPDDDSEGCELSDGLRIGGGGCGRESSRAIFAGQDNSAGFAFCIGAVSTSSMLVAGRECTVASCLSTAQLRSPHSSERNIFFDLNALERATLLISFGSDLTAAAEWENAFCCAHLREFADFFSSDAATATGDSRRGTDAFGTRIGTGVGGGTAVSANTAVASLLKASFALSGFVSSGIWARCGT